MRYGFGTHMWDVSIGELLYTNAVNVGTSTDSVDSFHSAQLILYLRNSYSYRTPSCTDQLFFSPNFLSFSSICDFSPSFRTSDTRYISALHSWVFSILPILRLTLFTYFSAARRISNKSVTAWITPKFCTLREHSTCRRISSSCAYRSKRYGTCRLFHEDERLRCSQS